MVKVKNKVLIALCVLLCAVLLSGVFVFIDNTKSLNADTETQSQNNINVQSNELTAMVTGKDVKFPVEWSDNIATMKNVNAYNYEQSLTSIWFTQTNPESLGYTHIGDFDTGVSVYDKATTLDDKTTYDLAFVNESGRIIAPENSNALFGISLTGQLNDGEVFNEQSHPLLQTNLKSITFDAYNVEENGKQVTKSIFDTSNVTNMAGMFTTNTSGYNNDVVISGLEYWDTKNVTNMSAMFYSVAHCNDVQINVSNFNTSSVTNMSYMFANCYKMTSLDVSSFDTSSVTNMNSMFNVGVTTLDVSNFVTYNDEKKSGVTGMSGMFADCSNVEVLNVSKFVTTSVTTMSRMFSGCSNLKTINLGGFKTSQVKTMSEMFSGCSSLTGIVFPESWDTSNVTTMASMFENCSSLTNLSLEQFSTNKVNRFENMFSGCTKLQSVDISKLGATSTKTVSYDYMFYNCESLIKVKFVRPAEKGIHFVETFYGCKNLREIDLSEVNLSSLGDTDDMFTGCESIVKIVLPESISEDASIELPTISSLGIAKADHYGYIGDNDEVVSITTDGATTITSEMAGKTIELYDNENKSLVQPIEPATGVNANFVAVLSSVVVLMIFMTYMFISNNKNKIKNKNN